MLSLSPEEDEDVPSLLLLLEDEESSPFFSGLEASADCSINTFSSGISKSSELVEEELSLEELLLEDEELSLDELLLLEEEEEELSLDELLLEEDPFGMPACQGRWCGGGSGGRSRSAGRSSFLLIISPLVL